MSRPVRLNKVDNQSFSHFSQIKDMIDAWCTRHALLIFSLLMGVLIVLFVMLMMVLIGPSATESGTIYNHFSDVI